MFRTLYSVSSDCQRFWCIEIDAANARHRIHHGRCDIEQSTSTFVVTTGAVISTNWKYVEEKHVGKSNHVSASDQCLLEAERLVVRKQKEGYFYWHEREQHENSSKLDPMLASTYEPGIAIRTKEVFFQPKLDGVRCLIELPSLIARSRNHNRFPKVEIQLSTIPSELLDPLKNEPVILDGEIYKHGVEIGPIISQLRKGIVDCTFNAFDLIVPSQPDMNFNERGQKLSEIIRHLQCPFITKVHTIKCIVNSSEELESKLATAYDLHKDYEGTMIRFNGPYEFQRSKYLYKFKVMIDREFTLVRFIEGEGQSAGLAASAIIKLSYTPEDIKMFPFLADLVPPECGVNVTGDADTRKEYLHKKWKPGTQVTVRFQGFNTSGMIRFGEVISVRNYE